MNNSIRLSLPRSRRVCGYTIKRAPLGALLGALDALQAFPLKLAERLFPGQGLGDALHSLKGCKTNELGALLARLMTIAPRMAVELVSRLTDIQEERLLLDPAIGLDGFAQIVTAWMEVNEIENFIKTANALRGKIKGFAVGKNGSKG